MATLFDNIPLLRQYAVTQLNQLSTHFLAYITKHLSGTIGNIIKVVINQMISENEWMLNGFISQKVENELFSMVDKAKLKLTTSVHVNYKAKQNNKCNHHIVSCLHLSGSATCSCCGCPCNQDRCECCSPKIFKTYNNVYFDMLNAVEQLVEKQ